MNRPATLYRGIAAPIMVEAPKRATKFAANEQYTALFKKIFGMEKVTQPLAIATGISAGVTEACIIVPFELVKIRMQDKANVSKILSLSLFQYLKSYSFIGYEIFGHHGRYTQDSKA